MATNPATDAVKPPPVAAVEKAPVAGPPAQSANCPCPDIAKIPRVEIEENGYIKYVAFTVRDPAIRTGVAPAIIIRGYKRICDYPELVNEVKQQLLPLICEPFTGGCIKHDPLTKTIHVFGSAEGIQKGKQDREYIAQIIREAYPGFKVTSGDKDATPPSGPATTVAPATATPATPASTPAPETSDTSGKVAASTL